MFTPFTQADLSTHSNYGGTGLGLSICARLCELMKGKIYCNSELGEGAEFVVELPIVHDSSVPPSDLKPNLAGSHIVLGEFEDEAHVYLSCYLDALGADCLPMTVFLKEENRPIPDNVDLIVLSSSMDANTRNSLIEKVCRHQDGPPPKVLFLWQRTVVDSQDIPLNVIYAEATPFLPIKVSNEIARTLGLYRTKEESKSIAVHEKLPSLEDAESKGELILVAEDNVFNQEVIERQLNLIGYVARFANNGQAALGLLKKYSFGLILTDCKMPVMDGYAFTRTIREMEEESDVSIPILAVTANVSKEDIRQCEESGMNDVISKPVTITDLKKKLDNWLPLSDPHDFSEEKNSVSTDEKDTSDEPVVNLLLLEEFLGDDPEIQKMFIEKYLENARDLIGKIALCIEGEEWQNASEFSHMLKSSSKSVGASVLSDLCSELEEKSKAADQTDAITLYSRLSGEFTSVEQYFLN